MRERAKKEHCFKYFETDRKLKEFWGRLRGSIFLPMEEHVFLVTYHDYFNTIKMYVQTTFSDTKDAVLKTNFPGYINYLVRNFFSRNSRYPIQEWTHFSGAPTTVIQLSNTNMAESLNQNLKKRFPRTGAVGLRLRLTFYDHLRPLFH